MELIIVAVVAVGLAIWLVVQSLNMHALRAELAKLNRQPHPLEVSQPTQAELEQKLTDAYRVKIAEATETFGVDLKNTSGKLSEQVSRLTTQVIEEELEAYQKTLEEVRHTATEAMEKIRQAVEQQRIELRDGMQAELKADQERLVAKFDTKLGDVVSSYIAESMGGGVDLGAQMQYIVASLESHKAEIKRDLTNGL